MRLWVTCVRFVGECTRVHACIHMRVSVDTSASLCVRECENVCVVNV